MEEVEGGPHREQHVVVVSLVQDDENQIAYLETEPKDTQSSADCRANNVDNHATPGASRAPAQRRERNTTLTLEWRFYQSAARTQTTCSETSAEERSRGQRAQVTPGLRRQTPFDSLRHLAKTILP